MVCFIVSVEDPHHVSFPSSYCQDISNGGEAGDEAVLGKDHGCDDYLRTGCTPQVSAVCTLFFD